MRRFLLPTALLAALLAATAPGAGAGLIEAFTEQVSPEAETNATEPSVAIDRSDGTVWVAWQASGTHVARSDDGGRSFVQTPIVNAFGRDLGDVDIAVGGPTPCTTPVAPTNITIGTTTAQTGGCLPGTHRVYVTAL